jgi:catechol 2,3-dioxygenase-like lactoylglutathione lyase family enzyme
MKRVTLVKLFVSDQVEALEFYTEKLGFEVAEDTTMGDYRWLLVRLPDNEEFCINLDVAKTSEQEALVGRQPAAVQHRNRRLPERVPDPERAWRRVRRRTRSPALRHQRPDERPLRQ